MIGVPQHPCQKGRGPGGGVDGGWCQTSLEATGLPYGEPRWDRSPLYDNLSFGKMCNPLVSSVSSQEKFPAGMGQFSLSKC